MPKIIKCVICDNLRNHQAKGMCHNCYVHKGTPIISCKKCGELKNHKGKGYCNNCFNKKFHYEGIKAHNARKYHNISYELYGKITQKCVLCDFNKIIELHHIDKNHKNNSPDNLIGLCPNPHKMIHNQRFSDKTEKQLMQKLYKSRLL